MKNNQPIDPIKDDGAKEHRKKAIEEVRERIRANGINKEIDNAEDFSGPTPDDRDR